MERSGAKPALARKATQKPAKTERHTFADLISDYELYGNRVHGSGGGYSDDPNADPGRVKFYYDPDHVVNLPQRKPDPPAPEMFKTKNGVRLVVAELDWNFADDELKDNEARWAPTTEGEPPHLLSLKEAARYTGTKQYWITRSIVVPFPPPDGVIGSDDGWLQSTLDRWNDRPSRGGRNWTTRHFVDSNWVAEMLGLPLRSTLDGVDLPAPDVLMGPRKGWYEITILDWLEQRPDLVVEPLH